MAKLIVAIEIPDHDAIEIEQQVGQPIEIGCDGIPLGYFNADGKIALDPCEGFDEDIERFFSSFKITTSDK